MSEVWRYINQFLEQEAQRELREELLRQKENAVSDELRKQQNSEAERRRGEEERTKAVQETQLQAVVTPLTRILVDVSKGILSSEFARGATETDVQFYRYGHYFVHTSYPLVMLRWGRKLEPTPKEDKLLQSNKKPFLFPEKFTSHDFYHFDFEIFPGTPPECIIISGDRGHFLGRDRVEAREFLNNPLSILHYIPKFLKNPGHISCFETYNSDPIFKGWSHHLRETTIPIPPPEGPDFP